MTLAVELYRGDPGALSSTWGSLSREERRRRAMRALRDGDTSALQDLTIAYLTLNRGRVSACTIRSYRTGVACLVRVAARRGLSLVQPQDEFANLFMRALEADGMSSATVRVRSSAGRILYRAVRWAGVAIPDPWDGRRYPRNSDAVIREPYPESDVARLLESPDVRVRAAVLLGAHAGLRAMEICDLVNGDIDLAQGQLTVRHGKGNKRRTVPLTDPLEAALRALPPGEADAPLLWQNYTNMRLRLIEVAKLCGVKWRGLHALRHTAGTELYRATGDLYVTAQLLGHANIATTQIYVHMSQSHLRAALKKRAG